jgi:F0F1-type ATP synthase membrane subunit b/b'
MKPSICPSLIASKILQRNITREDNERLIEEALKQVETPRH